MKFKYWIFTLCFETSEIKSTSRCFLIIMRTVYECNCKILCPTKKARIFIIQRLHFFLLKLLKKLLNWNSFTDQEILRKLEKEKILVFTPSRRVQGRRVVCYDDRFIVKLAFDSDGIIVSNDNYRDLQNEKPEWKKFIEERLLMYSFVNDKYEIFLQKLMNLLIQHSQEKTDPVSFLFP